MHEKTIRKIYFFTLMSPIFMVINIFMFSIMAFHIDQNGGQSGDYVLMYLSLFLVVISLVLAFFNYRNRKHMNQFFRVLSTILFFILIVIGVVFFASIAYSLKTA